MTNEIWRCEIQEFLMFFGIQTSDVQVIKYDMEFGLVNVWHLKVSAA